MKVNWDHYSQYMESHEIHGPNHQPNVIHHLFFHETSAAQKTVRPDTKNTATGPFGGGSDPAGGKNEPMTGKSRPRFVSYPIN